MKASQLREQAEQSATLLRDTAETIKNLLNSCPLPDLDRTILAARLEDIEKHLNTIKP